jgi:hypothetical protein
MNSSFSIWKMFGVLIVSMIICVSSLICQDSSWLEDVTMKVGLDNAHGARIVHADVNGDNYPDLLFGTGNIQKNRYFLYLNVPNPDTDSPYKRIYIDVTESSNINVNRNSEEYGRIVDCAAFADLDNDGDLDLVTSIYYHRWEYYNSPEKDPGDRSEVLLNDGNGKFSLVENSGITDVYLPEMMTVGLTNTTGISFLDYDQDGNIDMYFSEWFSDYKSNLDGLGEYKLPDLLFKGHGDGTFELVLDQAINNVYQPMYGVNVTDWNNDGWQDIITSPYCRSSGSLFENMKEGYFRDATFTAKYTAQKMGGDHGQALCQWEANPADFDNDGDMDLLQVSVHGGYDEGEGRTHISVNQGEEKKFEYVWELDRIERDAPMWSHLGDQGGAWFDLDNDTRLDLSIQQMGYLEANTSGQSRLYICKQNEDKYFDDISAELGIKSSMLQAHSLEPCDYDLDGDLDLFVSREISDTIVTGEGTEIISHMQVTLLQNNIGNKNNWIGVQVVQPDGVNKAGIGSRIYIKSDSITQIREIQAGLGHFAGQQQLIRFAGLGDVNRIDDIKVRLPNADLENIVVKNPPMNVIIKIDENGYAGYLKTWGSDKPIIQIKEPFLAFDTLHAGESKELLFHIQNIGEEVLEIKEIKMPNQDIAEYFSLIDVEFPINIEPNNENEFTLKFHPDKRQHFDGDLRIISNAQNAPDKGLDIYAYSHQDEPLIAVDKSKVEFQPIWIDSVDTQTMEIINKGELHLVITSIEFEDDEIFSCVADLPIEIEAGKHIKLDVSFQPDSVKDYESRMTIGSNGYYYPQFDVELKGICNGPAPIITVNTTNLFFGTVYVNDTKDRNFKLTNSGNSKMLINDFIFADHDDIYEIIDAELPIGLEVDESRNINIRFSPSYDGDFSTTMHLGSNAYNNDEISFNITGKGKESTSVQDERYVENDELQVIVSPVPFQSELAISYYLKTANSGNITFDLCNATGQMVDRIYGGFASAGENNILRDLSGISDGIYYLIVRYNREVLTIPIVRLR